MNEWREERRSLLFFMNQFVIPKPFILAMNKYAEDQTELSFLLIVLAQIKKKMTAAY